MAMPSALVKKLIMHDFAYDGPQDVGQAYLNAQGSHTTEFPGSSTKTHAPKMLPKDDTMLINARATARLAGG
jgi:hypothetical protein